MTWRTSCRRQLNEAEKMLIAVAITANVDLAIDSCTHDCTGGHLAYGSPMVEGPFEALSTPQKCTVGGGSPCMLTGVCKAQWSQGHTKTAFTVSEPPPGRPLTRTVVPQVLLEVCKALFEETEEVELSAINESAICWVFNW